jgi:hypothetical protein
VDVERHGAIVDEPQELPRLPRVDAVAPVEEVAPAPEHRAARARLHLRLERKPADELTGIRQRLPDGGGIRRDVDGHVEGALGAVGDFDLRSFAHGFFSRTG